MRRDVNRGLIDPSMYREQIGIPDSKRGLLRAFQSKATGIRSRERAFHPRGEQRVLRPSTAVFAMLRISPEGDRRVLALTNVTAESVELRIAAADLGSPDDAWRDLLGDRTYDVREGHLALELGAYDVVWLQPRNQT